MYITSALAFYHEVYTFLKVKLIVITTIILFFLFQNVRITQVLTAVTERSRTLFTTNIVTVESDLGGSVSKGPLVQEYQLHVRRNIDVALICQPG